MAKLGKITEKEYNEISAVRNSELGNIEKSWEHYKLGTDRTEAMIFGTAFHMYILEEPVFWENFIVAPKYDGRTTEGKKIKAQLDEQALAGKDILRSDDFDTIVKMKTALLSHPMAKNILHRSENEGAYTATLEGVECKAKLDLENKGYFFDLKTCQDASFNGFRKSIGTYRYDRQAAFYSDVAVKNGLPFTGFVFVAIEKEPPYSVGCWMMDEATIDLGRASYKRVLNKYKFHIENPEAFQGINGEISPIAAPNWLFMDEATKENGI